MLIRFKNIKMLFILKPYEISDKMKYKKNNLRGQIRNDYYCLQFSA